MKTTVLMTVNLDSWGLKAPGYLKQAIVSINKQTTQDFKFLILFDGYSIEFVHELLNYIDCYNMQFGNCRIRANPKEGLTETLNTGLDIVDTEFILRQDADDYSAPGRLEKLLKIMESDDKIGAVGCNYGVVDSEGKLLHINTANPEKLPVERLAGSIAGGGCLLRTDVVKKIGGWRYPYAQDFYMWVKMRQLGYRIVSSKETLYYYRQHPGQISVAKREAQKAAHKEIIRKEIIGEGSQKDTKSV